MPHANSDLSPLEAQQLQASASVLGSFWHRARSALVQDLVDGLGATEVVDVGAGAGHLGNWLRRTAPGVRYRYQEPLQSLAEGLATQFGPDNRVLEDEDLRSADLVTLLDVIEHVADDKEFLISLHRRLRVGATVAVTVPALPALHSWWDDALGHHRRYRRRDLIAVLEDSGFTVEHCRYLFPELLLPALLRKIRPGGHATEFPAVPRPIDRLAYLLLRATSRRLRWPGGTSLLALARRE